MPGRRAVALFAVLMAVSAGTAVAARWMLEERHPGAPADWWRPPAAEPPLIDKETLARAAAEIRRMSEELADLRRRIAPAPERLAGGVAIPQTGHTGPVTAVAGLGGDFATGGADGTLRWWRPAPGTPRLLRAAGLGGPIDVIAAAADPARIAAFIAPDRIVELRGDLFAYERTRYVIAGRVEGLAYGDAGRRLAALVVRPGPDGPRWSVLHYEPDELVLLKETPLSPALNVTAASLAHDAASVAFFGESAGGAAIETLDAEDGRSLQVTAVDRPPAPPGPWVCDGSPSTRMFGGRRVDAALGGGAWKDAPASDGAPTALACLGAGEYVVGAVDGSVRVVSAAGSGFVAGAPTVLAAAFADGARTVRVDYTLAEGDGVANPAHVRASLDLRTFETVFDAASAVPLAVDADSGLDAHAAGGMISFRDRAGVPQTIEEARRPTAAVLRDGVLALAVAGADGTELVVANDAGTVRRTLPAWLGDGRVVVAVGPGGAVVVATGPGGFVAYRAGEAEPVLDFATDAYVDAAADATAGGGRVALGTSTGTVDVWDPASGERERSFVAFLPNVGAVTSLRYGADGETLLVGASRGGLFAFHARTGNPLWSSLPHSGPVLRIAFSPTGRHVLTADPASVSLTGARTGAPLLAWTPAGGGRAVTTTPDGYHMLAGDGAAGLAGLRIGRAENDPRGKGYDVVTGDDEDHARMSSADALRATLLAAGETPHP